MRKLELNQMENLQGGGWECALSIAGLGLTFLGMFALAPVTGGASLIALVSTLGGFVVGGAAAGLSC